MTRHSDGTACVASTLFEWDFRRPPPEESDEEVELKAIADVQMEVQGRPQLPSSYVRKYVRPGADLVAGAVEITANRFARPAKMAREEGFCNADIR